MKLFSSGSVCIFIVLGVFTYLKRNQQESQPRPTFGQAQAVKETRPRKQNPSATSQPQFTEEQKQMGIMLLQAIMAAAMQNQQQQQARSTSPDYSEFYGYQPGRSQSQYPALRGEPSPTPSNPQQQPQRYQQPPSYQLSTSMPGGSTEAQTFVNEYNRIVPGASPGDALNLYEAIRQIR